MATCKIPQRPTKAEEMEKLSETALAFVKEGLNLEENNQETSALLHYEEGLHLLDRALAIDPIHDDTNSAKTRANMSRTRQQVVFRIHEIRTKMDPPPTYEESLEEQKNNNDESIIPSVPSDAQILFTIAGHVQIFYIKMDGSVSAPSYPSSLFIFRFCDSKEDSAFLQVGTWVYPLVKGKSPILKSNEGAYMFPDLDESIEGNAIGLILPNDILDIEKQEFERILEELTKTEDLKDYDDCLEYSTQVSAGLMKGAEVVGRGMVKGAIKSSEWMYLGAEKLKDKINPESNPREVDPRLKASLGAARWMTSHTVKASGYLVSKAGSATCALGRFLAPHIKNHSAKALSHIIEQSDTKSQKQLDIASELASGTLTAMGTVYSALENSSRILATNVANNTVQIVSHKYGTELGSATENALTTVGNTYLTAYNATALGPKALAKRAVKTTGKVAVGVSEDVILGRTGLATPNTNTVETSAETKAIEGPKEPDKKS